MLKARHADDVQGAEHDSFIPFGKGHHHRVLDDGRILRVIDAKVIAAAAPDLERLKRRLLKIQANLLEHPRTIPFGKAEASHPHFFPAACFASYSAQNSATGRDASSSNPMNFSDG